jgi:hypothetical protein
MGIADVLLLGLQVLLSINTLTLIWLVGSRKVLGWWLAVAGQAGWLVFIVASGSWGFLIMWVGLTGTYTRNLIRWRAEGADDGRPVG